jgi:poly-gamma-glutamate synthesis protein (capsule biosynthesis protein)
MTSQREYWLSLIRWIESMRIVFLGDISVSKKEPFSSVGLGFLQEVDHVVANLEGPILPEDEINLIDQQNRRVLYNSEFVIEILKEFQVDVVSLANNHIFDADDSLDFTRKVLSDAGIGFFGAGDHRAEARNPYLLNSMNEEVLVFGFGWNVIGCRYAIRDNPGVNPYEPDHLLETIRETRKEYPRSKIIYYIHWNYELEKYPQPADRQLARLLIDEGVDAIIGTHPHLVQGGEYYRGKPIVYSLGNWFFPPRNFGGFSLEYPSESTTQLALELEYEGQENQSVSFYWCKFNQENGEVLRLHVESWEGQTLKELTPFKNMTHTNYINWFKKNRAKDKLLPVYSDFRKKILNFIFDSFVKIRSIGIFILLRLKIKS